MWGTEIITKLLESNRIVDVFKLVRFTYKIDNPMVDDSFYKKIEDVVISENLSPLVNQTYDDDDIPVDLLKEFCLESLIPHDKDVIDENSEFYKYLDSAKSCSIKAISSFKETFVYFMSTKNEQHIISPKGNGWNYKGLYVKDNDSDSFNYRKLYITRGRSSNGMLVTDGISKLVPSKIVSNAKEVTVWGEGLTTISSLDYLRKSDGSKFTSVRMAAGSLIRTNSINDENKKYVHYYVFNAEGVADTISESLDILKEQGFETMPYKIIEPSEVPENLDDFIKWFQSIMDELFQICLDLNLSADGLVIDVNDKHFSGSDSNQYNSRNCAVKFGYWSQCFYRGIISKIEIKQQEVYASVQIIIDPINTNDSCVARRITSYNVGILKELGLTVGSEVYFERNSEAINVILRGDKLNEAKGLVYVGDSAVKDSSQFLS